LYLLAIRYWFGGLFGGIRNVFEGLILWEILLFAGWIRKKLWESN
jgi:hypothetical protein